MLRSHAVGVRLGQRQRREAAARQVWRDYHAILRDLHWQNAVVDTVSSYVDETPTGERLMGRHPHGGPVHAGDRRRTGSAARYRAARGASAEQGDNEHIPPFASLKKFIPPDKLWPINDTWYFHAGSNPGNASADQHPAGRQPPLRAVRRCRGVRPQSPTRALRVDARPVRVVRRARLGRPQDDDLLDAQQPLAVVLRQHLRLLPAAGRRVLRREEGPAAAVGGLRLLRDRRPQPGQRHAGQPDARRPVTDVRVRVRVYDLQGRVRDDRTTERRSTVAVGRQPSPP